MKCGMKRLWICQHRQCPPNPNSAHCGWCSSRDYQRHLRGNPLARGVFKSFLQAVVPGIHLSKRWLRCLARISAVRVSIGKRHVSFRGFDVLPRTCIWLGCLQNGVDKVDCPVSQSQRDPGPGRAHFHKHYHPYLSVSQWINGWQESAFRGGDLSTREVAAPSHSLQRTTDGQPIVVAQSVWSLGPRQPAVGRPTLDGR